MKTTSLCFPPCRWNMKGTPCGKINSGRGHRQVRERYKPNTAHLHESFSVPPPYLTNESESNQGISDTVLVITSFQRMEEQIKSSQKNTSDEVAKASADQLLTSQACDNQDHSSSLPHAQSAWLSHLHPQWRCPVSAPLQPSQLHHLASLTGQNDQTWRRQSAPDQASVQSDPPQSWVAGIPSGPDALWEQLNVEDGDAERQALQAETSGAPSSKTERSGRRSCSSHLSQELDDKPGRRKKATG